MDKEMNYANPPPSGDLAELVSRERGLLTDAERISLVGLSKSNTPEAEREVAIAEEALSAELERLSLVEQEQALFDVHGLPQVHNEDPPDVDKYLEGLEREVQKIGQRQYYEYAKYLNESYVMDRSFRLMFLRCDMFDVKLAAQRMVLHFETKRVLFDDDEVLAREVRLSDLSEEDMCAMESGFIQVLPSRDAAGRFIIAITPMFRPDNVSLTSGQRVMWYIFSVVNREEETQRKGVVGVMYNTGHKARPEPFLVYHAFHWVRSGLPKKVGGLHYCFENVALKPFVTGIHLSLSKEMRNRFRIHFGNFDDIKFELQTFGIPTKDLPVQQDGTLSLEWHKEWVRARKIQEQDQHPRSVNGLIVPRRFDVLFGRGKHTREHTGNLRAYHLVEMSFLEYENANKCRKTEIAQRIVDIIHESYGRFLRWEEGGWVEVDDEDCHKKISHFFRQMRSKKLEDGGTITEPRAAKRVTPSVSPVHSEEPEARRTKGVVSE